MTTAKLRKSALFRMMALGLILLSVLGLAPLPAEGMVTTVAQRTGVTVHNNAKVSIDASNLEEGYVIIRYLGGRDIRIKAQIAKKDGSTYSYDINSKGDPEVLPLTEGDGAYTIGVFEQVSGNRYAQAHSVTVNAKLRDQLLPFLYPNQYVNFTVGSAVDKQAQELTKSVTGSLDKVREVYHFVTKNLTYDVELAKSVQPGYLPNVNAVLERKKGICFDYAALMSAMLRLQGIPCKLVIGYAGTLYHAWINVFIEDTGWIDQAIFFNGTEWSLMDPTFVSTSNSSNAVRQFVGQGNSYTQKFVY